MGHSKWSAVRRPSTPERDGRIAAMVEAMRDAATLAQVRASREVTQVELAERLGKRQSTVSEIERRDDVYLSTLREYVEALGGELAIEVVFPDERITLRLGSSSMVPAVP